MDLILSTTSYAQSLQDSPTIEVLTPYTQVKTSNVLSLVVRFENNTNEDLEFLPELEIPEDWRLLIPLGRIYLLADSSKTIPFSVIIPPTSFAGTYEIKLALPLGFSDRQEQVFSVDIVPVEDIQLTVVSQPDYVIDESYSIEYLIRNYGNEVQDYSLVLKDTLNYDMTIEPSIVQLAPQESATLKLKVFVPEVNVQQRHATTLSVVNVDGEEVASRYTTVDLVPQSLSQALIWHYFPFELSVNGTFDTTSPLSIDSLLSNIDFSLSGYGKLFDEDVGDFRMTARSVANLDNASLFGEYIQPSYSVSVGKFSANLGGLLASSNSWGMAFSNNWTVTDNIDVKNQVLINSNAEIGLGVSPSISMDSEDILDFALAALVPLEFSNSDTSSTNAVTPTVNSSKGTRIASSANFRTRDSRFAVRSNYILEMATSTDSAAGAFDFDTTVRFAANRLSANLNFKQLGYQGRKDDFLYFDVNLSHFNSDLNLNFSALAKVGMNLTETQTSQDYSFNVRGGNDQFIWLLASDIFFKDFGEDSSGFNVQARITLPLFGATDSSFKYYTAYTTQNLIWSHKNKLDNKLFQYIKYQADLYVPFGSNNFKTSLATTYDWNHQVIDQLSLTANYHHNFEPLNVNLGVEYRPFNDNYFQLNADAILTLNTGDQLSLESRTSFFEDKDPIVSISLGSKWFFDVPTSQLSSVGQVKGTIIKSNGEPVADTIVEISGSKVVTKSDGSFAFPVVPEGQAFFRIPLGELADNEITNPPSPYVFDVTAKESYQLDFEVVETASLKGEFIYDSSDDSSSVQVSVSERDVVSGLIMILIHSNGTTIRREISNSLGEFEFLSLIPGEWSVTISHALAEDQYKILLEEDIIVIAEGQQANLTILIEPVRRPIRFTEGGTVTSK